MKHLFFFAVATGAALIATAPAWSGQTGSAGRPNILFIITDDQERREFNFLPEGRDEQGRPRNLSPNIDRLATQGLVLLNQYVSSPVCTPSRYAVLTGTYASRSPTFAKAVQNSEQINITWNSHMDRETPNIARTLKKAGYFTGAVGKNHVIEAEKGGRAAAPPEDADPRQPEVAAYYATKQRQQVEAFKACGFDYAASLYAGNLPGHTCKALEFHNMDWITGGALAFLDEWKGTGKPFFLYMATTLNHGPGPRYKKYTGNPLATPAGFLEKPLSVQPSRSSVLERVRLAFRLPESLPDSPSRPYTHLADRPGGRGSEGPAMRFYPNYYDKDQLYDIRNDPLERKNLCAEAAQKDRAAAMRELLREAVAKVPGPFAEFKTVSTTEDQK